MLAGVHASSNNKCCNFISDKIFILRNDLILNTIHSLDHLIYRELALPQRMWVARGTTSAQSMTCS
jgi:hypothetical protein